MKTKGEGGDERRWLYSITNSLDVSLSRLQKMVKDREAWHATDPEVAESQTQLSNSTAKHKSLGLDDFTNEFFLVIRIRNRSGPPQTHSGIRHRRQSSQLV